MLSYFFECDPLAEQVWLDEQANTIMGMVAADAGEVHIARYLCSVVRDTGAPNRERLGARPTAIALWHIAKAALVRDFAERVLQGEVPANTPTPDSLGHWVAARILSPEELRRYEAEAERADTNDGPQA